MKRNVAILDGFGFSFADFPQEKLVRLAANVSIPLCMNLRGKGIVCWLNVEGDRLLEPKTEECVGLLIRKTTGCRVEVAERAFPTEGVPVFKISPAWPAIRLDLPASGVRYAGPDDWGVSLREQDNEDARKEARP